MTLLLVALFFAAWKAPRWVMNIGTIALSLGVVIVSLNVRHLITVLNQVAGGREDITGLLDMISPHVLFNALEIWSVQFVYSLVIFLVAVIINMLQKPRV